MLALVCTTSIGKAESSPSNEKRMEKLEAALKAMQAELAELKAEQAEAAKVPVDQKRIDAMVNKAFDEKKADLKLVPDWVNNVKIKGDLRYRHEWKDDESQADDRNRHRIRARIGIYGKVNDEVDLGFRLASGNTSTPTSTNQDLDTAFSSKNIWLDLAYFDYHPAAVEGLKVLGGKIKDPYFRAGKSNLMFDSDVNPEVKGIGNANEPNVIAKPTAEMRTESTFTDAGWDFVEVWNIGENQTYPFLRTHPAGDINHDDKVNFTDLAILAAHWLEDSQ